MNYRKIFIFIIFSFLINLIINGKNNDDKNNNILQSQLSKIKENIDKKSINLKKYNKSIKTIDKKITKEDHKIKKIQDSLIRIDLQQIGLQQELDELKKNIKDNEATIKQYLLIMHKLNNYSKIKLLYDDSLNMVLILNYLKALNNYEKTNFNIIKQKIFKINKLNKEIKITQKEYKNKNKELHSIKKNLLELKEKKVFLKENIEREINNHQNKLAEILKKITKANKYSNNKPNLSKKHLIMPVHGTIINSFDNNLNNQLIQNGSFIINKSNEKFVHAIDEGKIVFANWLKLYGNVVIIDHQNGYMSLYANNKENLLKVGSFVQAGEQIAVIGNSGAFDQQGSYFELRYQGKPQSLNKLFKTG